MPLLSWFWLREGSDFKHRMKRDRDSTVPESPEGAPGADSRWEEAAGDPWAPTPGWRLPGMGWILCFMPPELGFLCFIPC